MFLTLFQAFQPKMTFPCPLGLCRRWRWCLCQSVPHSLPHSKPAGDSRTLPAEMKKKTIFYFDIMLTSNLSVYLSGFITVQDRFRKIHKRNSQHRNISLASYHCFNSAVLAFLSDISKSYIFTHPSIHNHDSSMISLLKQPSIILYACVFIITSSAYK